MMACDCRSVNSKRDTRPSRASLGVLAARIRAITASRLSSALWKPEQQVLPVSRFPQ